MIKINLLGVAPPPQKPEAGPQATITLQVVTFLGALLVSFAIVGIIYKVWSSQIAELEQRLKQEKVRQTELAGVKAQNQKYQQRLRDLETRINTIQALQNSRVGPVEMMTALGNVVDRSTEVYLYTVAPASDRIEVKGQSGTVDSMANFLGSLKNSGYFDDVQLRQFFQDDQHNRLNYKFTLDCLFKSPTGAVIAPGPGAPAAPPASGPGIPPGRPPALVR